MPPPPGVSWGQFVQPVPIPRFTCIRCAHFIPNRSSRLTTFPTLMNCWPTKTPQKLRRGLSWGELFLAYVHSQMNPQTCTEFGANRSIRLAAFPDINLWPPKTPRNAPCDIEGRIVFSYVHSQTNPQKCTKFGANRSSSLTACPDIWFCDPLKKPKCPWGIVRRIVFSLCPFQTNPQTCTKFGANRCSRLTASPDFWICDPPPPPQCHMGYWGRLGFSLCPFPDESADVNQSWCQSVQPFDSFPRLLNVWPLTPPPPPSAPLCLKGQFFLSYIHSQMDLQMCAKFGVNRSSRLTASPDFLICDTQHRPRPFPLEVNHCCSYRLHALVARDLVSEWMKCPLGYWGATCI